MVNGKGAGISHDDLLAVVSQSSRDAGRSRGSREGSVEKAGLRRVDSCYADASRFETGVRMGDGSLRVVRDPIASSESRKLGCALLTRAMRIGPSARF